jgi:hypothetical protein
MLAGQDPRFVRSVRFWLSLEQELRMFIASRFIATSLSIATLAFAMSTPDIAAAADRRVRVVNGTNVTVTSFYASNTGRGSWEEDILGSSVLPAGRSVMINIDDGSGACMFDFRAVLANGRRVEAYGMNVCQISSWTVR